MFDQLINRLMDNKNNHYKETKMYTLPTMLHRLIIYKQDKM